VVDWVIELPVYVGACRVARAARTVDLANVTTVAERLSVSCQSHIVSVADLDLDRVFAERLNFDPTGQQWKVQP
jgi:hypothetical protein